MNPARGILTAMITPFASDGAVDQDAARKLARFLIENGSDGLVVAGTTGESPTLTDEEQVALLRAVVDEVGGETTIVCGSGTNDTRHASELTRACCDAGADAVLVVTPYYNKPNEDGIRAHFAAVAAAADPTPLIVYNIPSRTVVNIPPALLDELGEIENVVAVKQANNDEIDQVSGLEVLAGNDDIFLRCLETGGTGGILVASHLVGAEMGQIMKAAEIGDLDRARQLDESVRDVYEMVACDTNPIPIKAAMALLGHCGPTMRLPMTEPSPDVSARVQSTLEAHGMASATA
jgi:4-hydroxy-tetrahydrodipicolinate synthase